MSLRLHSLFAAALLTVLAHPLHAQRTLTGTVQDPQGAAVPFAVLELPTHKLGVQADDEGRFSLPLPAGLAPTDSLTVSALGYARQRVPVPAGTTATLQLAALPVSLNEVVVRGTRAAPVVLGTDLRFKSYSGFSQSGLSPAKHTGWQIARFFAPVTSGQLTEVSFFVKRHATSGCRDIYRAPFRVRVYAADGPNHTPGADLLLTSVLAAATKPGWLTIDLRQYQLPVDSSGFYVAMEWVYTDSQYLCANDYTDAVTKQKKQSVSYGLSLGGEIAENTQSWYLFGSTSI